jgi:tRNA A-37 threonylcarbamoyl transferase component Bud32
MKLMNQPGGQDYSQIINKFGIGFKRGGSWLLVGEAVPSQNWLLFVSVIIADMLELLRAILPELRKEKIPFRLIRDQMAHCQLNAGHLGETEFGKVLTIYPGSIKRAKELAACLLPITECFRGPVVEDCIRLGKIFYVGYTAKGLDSTGHPICLTIPSKRQIPFDIPYGYALNKRMPGIINGHLAPYAVINAGLKGALYKAIDIRNLGLCLLKRGRAYTADDLQGRHIRHRLIWEMQMMERLWGVIPIPKVIEFFDYREDSFLVMEFIGQVSLRKKIQMVYQRNTWFQLPGQTREALLSDYLEILNIIDRLHNEGYIHRDITDTNFLVPVDHKKGQQVYILDFELTYDVKARRPDPPFALGTPGYVSPEQLCYNVPTFQEDIYSLGALLVFMLTGRLPDAFIAPVLEETRVKLLKLGVHTSVAAIATKCLRRNPLERPTITQIKQTITDSL